MLQSHFYTAGKAIYITLVRAELSFPLIMKKNTEQSSSDVNQLLIQAVILLQRQYLLAEHLVGTGSFTLANFEQAVAERTQSIENVFGVFNYCWALID